MLKQLILFKGTFFGNMCQNLLYYIAWAYFLYLLLPSLAFWLEDLFNTKTIRVAGFFHSKQGIPGVSVQDQLDYLVQNIGDFLDEFGIIFIFLNQSQILLDPLKRENLNKQNAAIQGNKKTQRTHRGTIYMSKVIHQDQSVTPRDYILSETNYFDAADF